MKYYIRAAVGIAVLIAGASLTETKASASTVIAINGGSSWTGWKSRGFSNTLGVFAEGATTMPYEVYTTSFVFDNHAKTPGTLGGPTGGTTGFGTGTYTQGAFANGNKMLGVGIRLLNTQVNGAVTVKFDIAGDSYTTASSVGGTDGRVSNSQYAHRGDYVIQFDRQGVVNLIHMQGGTGEFFGGPNIKQSFPRDSHGKDLPARMFYIRGNAGTGTTGSYQAFFDMTALDSLWGARRTDNLGAETWAGIGDANKDTIIALQGQGVTGSSHVVFSAAVPEPSTWAMMIIGFGIAGATMRRRVTAAVA